MSTRDSIPARTPKDGASQSLTQKNLAHTLTIQQAIRELRREVLTGLRDESPLPDQASWTANRITLSLALQINPSNAPNEPTRFCIALDPSEALHKVELEFLMPLTDAHPTSLEEPSQDHLPPSTTFATLSEVFGAPGFDSSARATVFRELLEDLSPQHQQEVLVSLKKPESPHEDAAVTYARNRILRLASSGPAKDGRGPELLSQLALRESVQTLVLQAAVHWRTQSEWASESSPYAQ